MTPEVVSFFHLHLTSLRSPQKKSSLSRYLDMHARTNLDKLIAVGYKVKKNLNRPSCSPIKALCQHSSWKPVSACRMASSQAPTTKRFQHLLQPCNMCPIYSLSIERKVLLQEWAFLTVLIMWSHALSQYYSPIIDCIYKSNNWES